MSLKVAAVGTAVQQPALALDAEPSKKKSSAASTIPATVVSLICSFLRGADSRQAAGIGRTWRSLARFDVNGREISQLVGDQNKDYAVRAVVMKLQEVYFAKFPNICELNLRSLVLNHNNDNSEYLIPRILQQAPKSIHTLRLPHNPGPAADDSFMNRLFFGIFLNLPNSITSIDLRMYRPTHLTNPFPTLQKEIDTSKVTSLVCHDQYENISDSILALPSCFPNLRSLQLELIEDARMSAIAQVINKLPHLQNLTLASIVADAWRVLLRVEERQPSASCQLQQVTLIRCGINLRVINFFKQALAPSGTFHAVDCPINLAHASMTLSARALPSFREEKAESKQSA